MKTAMRRRHTRQFSDLFEGASDAKVRMRQAVRLLEQIQSGEISCRLGVLRESMSSDAFATLTADLMHLRALKGFSTVPGGDDWRKIVSDITPVADFKNQYGVALSEIASLDDVAASGKYVEKYFTDEKTQYKVAKKGNIISADLEALANDQLNFLGKSGEKLGRAGKRSLLNFVFNTLIDANPTLGRDSTALFHTNHANKLGSSTPLNMANLEAAWKKLRAQTGLAGEQLQLTPRYLIVHTDDEIQANILVNSMGRIAADNATGSVTTTFVGENNFFKGKLEVIAQNYITSGRWYLAASPEETDTIEIGFFQGKQEPEILQENKGNAHEFDTDKTRWKGRYIFGGVDLDYRWIVGANF